MRTKLFWTGPLGCGGAIGTGTATTFCGGVFARIPGGTSRGLGSTGELEGGAPFGCCPFCCCCANDVEATSNANAIKMGTPFMPEGLEDETKGLKSNRSNFGAIK
ncbi:MAG: hypothetical protein M3O72_04135 [Verrucomicrobiota bacterium]|nr:hypothetical protein [Verrucomicrobiota bacterium]